jgi:hypothetical protein
MLALREPIAFAVHFITKHYCADNDGALHAEAHEIVRSCGGDPGWLSELGADEIDNVRSRAQFALN